MNLEPTAFPLAVVAALEDELRDLRSRLAGPQPLPLTGGRLTVATWGRLPLLLGRTGVGPEATGRTLRRLLSENSPGLCLQVGYAGGAQAELQPGDLIIATTLVDAARGLSFEVAPELVAQAEILRRRAGLPGRGGPLVTVPQPVLAPRDKTALGRDHQALALDMESAAFAEICRAAALPFLVVRAILDPLDYHLPEPVRGKNPCKNPPLSDFADLARRSLTAFTAAWLEEMAASWPDHPPKSVVSSR